MPTTSAPASVTTTKAEIQQVRWLQATLAPSLLIIPDVLSPAVLAGRLAKTSLLTNINSVMEGFKVKVPNAHLYPDLLPFWEHRNYSLFWISQGSSTFHAVVYLSFLMVSLWNLSSGVWVILESGLSATPHSGAHRLSPLQRRLYLHISRADSLFHYFRNHGFT